MVARPTGSSQDTAEHEKPDTEADAKKQSGKLPKVPKGPTAKDSREAAAAILRKMVNRR